MAIGDTIYHKNTIVTVGGIEINDPQGIVLQASKEIILDATFETAYGTEFVAEIVPYCESYERPVRRSQIVFNKDTQNDSLVNTDRIVMDNINSFDVYPVPTNDRINVHFTSFLEGEEI